MSKQLTLIPWKNQNPISTNCKLGLDSTIGSPYKNDSYEKGYTPYTIPKPPGTLKPPRIRGLWKLPLCPGGGLGAIGWRCFAIYSLLNYTNSLPVKGMGCAKIRRKMLRGCLFLLLDFFVFFWGDVLKGRRTGSFWIHIFLTKSWEGGFPKWVYQKVPAEPELFSSQKNPLQPTRFYDQIPKHPKHTACDFRRRTPVNTVLVLVGLDVCWAFPKSLKAEKGPGHGKNGPHQPSRVCSTTNPLPS